MIVSHAVAGIVALCVLIGYALLAGPADPTVLFSLALLASPLAIAFLLARTGWLLASHMISALALTALIGFVAWHTGGLSSFLLVWLVVVPVESALSASRRCIAIGLVLPALALIALGAGEISTLLPPDRSPNWPSAVLTAVGTGTALIYAGLVALTVQRLASRSEAVARDSERLYRLMAENATDLISLHDHDGTARFVAPGADRVLGVGDATLADEGFASAFIPEHGNLLRDALGSTARDGEDRSVDLQTRSIDHEGEPRWVEIRCRRLDSDARDQLGDVIAVSRDLTQRKADEAALRTARDEAERANLSKSRFLATVSHELRTPLNAIIGLSEVLSNPNRPMPNGPQDAEFVTLIHESGHHLLTVVNDLLDMSKLDAGRYEITREPFDLQATLSDCIDVMRTVAESSHVSLRLEPVASTIPVDADKRTVKQIALNLLSNAIKFSRDGGQVVVRAWTSGQRSCFSVADNGVGITPEAQQHLGEPFFQAEGGNNRSHEGTGLGLSIVKGLIALHDGRLKIESRFGEGSCFTVELDGAATNSTSHEIEPRFAETVCEERSDHATVQNVAVG